MTRPPPDGAAQLTRTTPGPVTSTVGVPGAPGAAGVIDADCPDAIDPAGPFAVTTNQYDVAPSRPVKSHASTVTATHGDVRAGTEATV